MRRLLSTVMTAIKASFMPRFVALRIEHKLDDLVSFFVSAVVLAAAGAGNRPSTPYVIGVFCRVFCLILLQDLLKM